MLRSQLLDRINPDIKEILEKPLKGQELSTKDALKLLKVTGKEFFALQHVADRICQEKKENIVTFIINRNINFTNICNKGCRFCSFSVSKNSQEGFLLSIDELREKVIEAKNNHCTEVCIQGGINPDLSFDYYLDILKTVKEVDKNMHIHAFSPQEVFNMSELWGDSLENTLIELKATGLDSMPGTAAEILVDDVRKIICPNKVSTPQWIDIIETAHYIGIPTTSTIMYGHVEELKNRVEHLDVLRNIQKETMGFTEFVPLVYMRENPVLSRSDKYKLKPNYGIDDLRLYAVSRLFLNDYIDNIQCSWVKLGPKFAQVSLEYGVNDFSGTLMEENISKTAGSRHGEYLPPEEIIDIIRTAGKHPAQRDTLYNIIKEF
ncbi:MAG: 7,8-didemethyl-8-hydroxy-5-deazariboflavin synthase subunit CofH [Promethearchaeota archaeon]